MAWKAKIPPVARRISTKLPTLRPYHLWFDLHHRSFPAETEFDVDDIDQDLRMVLRPFDYVDFNLYYCHRLYERAGQRALGRILRPGMTFVDVGAHIGFFTLLAAKRVAQGGRVVSFEPDPRTYPRLVRNVSLNPNLSPFVTTVNAAVSDARKKAQLFAMPSPDGSTLLGSMVADARAVPVDVQCVTLDDVVMDLPGLDRGVMLKIDAEGSELAVLRGATSLIERVRPWILFEASEELLQGAGTSVQKLVGRIREWGYEVHVLGDRGPTVYDDHVPPLYSNMLAVPPDKTFPHESRWHKSVSA